MSRKLLSIAAFEISYYLRRISTWVYFGIFFTIAVLLICAVGGAFPNMAVGIGGTGGNVNVNAPRSLLIQMMGVSTFGFIVTAALLGNTLYRDIESRIHPLFFTTPVTKLEYLGGRFVGALATNALIFLAIPLGFLFGSTLPILDEERMGPIRLAAYFQPYLVGILPNLLLTGAIFFGLAALTRQMLANYVGGVVLLVGYLIASGAQDLEDQTRAALTDPFGMSAMDLATRYWTAAEQNALLLPFEGIVLWNRVLWMTVGLAILGLTYWRFSFSQSVGERAARRKAAKVVETAQLNAPVNPPRPQLTFGRQASLRQYLAITRSSFQGIVLNRYFVAIVGAAIIFLMFMADQVGKLYGTVTYPVTYQVLEILGGTFALFVLIVITFYGGELIWRERDQRIDQVFDATPISNWVVYAAKLSALFAVVVMLQVVLLLAGIVTQAANGFYDFDIPQYLATLFGFNLVDYALLCVLITLIHVIVRNKYMGHAVAILYFVLTLFAAQLGLEHNLYTYGSGAFPVYSDMNGFGPYVEPFFWFKAYWAAWAILLALATNLLWMRGRETGVKWRLSLARQRLTGRVAAAGIVAAGLVLALGGFVFYNTNVLNDFRTREDVEAARARYEREYRRFENALQPRIVGVDLEVDIFPSDRDVVARGVYRLVNRGAVPIDSVFLLLPNNADLRRAELGRAAERVLEDREAGVQIYDLAQPLAPADSMSFTFEVAYTTQGFENSVSELRIVENGTFIASDMMPMFGYNAQLELQDDDVRRQHDLEPQESWPGADDLQARMNNPLTIDADWIDFRAVVSTSADQVAVAPGYLQREWEEGGRRYFEYLMDAPMLGMYSILSARYEVRRDRWNDVAIEIFYHPDHPYNVDRMIEGIKKSLDYYTREFGPYQHRQVRILEFPRYQAFAQSFPNTIPYSESIGFIARIEDPEVDIDYPFYVTAHEVAHQWWAHQTIGGAVQGSTFIIETLAQYSAMMVMEEEYGEDQVKRFLKYELDSYLTGRTLEREKELPLLQVEGQNYIHYNKGAVVMYALRDYIGEDQLNGALRAFLDATKFQQPPYTSSMELYEHLRRATPDSLQYVLEDMFEEITLYGNRTTSATAEQGGEGSYTVTLEVEAQKVRADSLGNETVVPMNDLIDIGVYGPEPDEGGDGPLLYLRKHRISSGVQSVVVEVSGVPARAGIDPMNKLIDRNSEDNTRAVELQAP